DRSSRAGVPSGAVYRWGAAGILRRDKSVEKRLGIAEAVDVVEQPLDWAGGRCLHEDRVGNAVAGQPQTCAGRRTLLLIADLDLVDPTTEQLRQPGGCDVAGRPRGHSGAPPLYGSAADLAHHTAGELAPRGVCAGHDRTLAPLIQELDDLQRWARST